MGDKEDKKAGSAVDENTGDVETQKVSDNFYSNSRGNANCVLFYRGRSHTRNPYSSFSEMNYANGFHSTE
jgi:hypothetical protein